ncbi:hypothetical protein [Mesomycoplasma ovipneumoniae]|uniref:hypothetical protein n=1 Tax=Mesomycoplasma ovipneumoniae TaxID=29562 RepID=UPI00311CAF65
MIVRFKIQCFCFDSYFSWVYQKKLKKCPKIKLEQKSQHLSVNFFCPSLIYRYFYIFVLTKKRIFALKLGNSGKTRVIKVKEHKNDAIIKKSFLDNKGRYGRLRLECLYLYKI